MIKVSKISSKQSILIDRDQAALRSIVLRRSLNMEFILLLVVMSMTIGEIQKPFRLFILTKRRRK